MAAGLAVTAAALAAAGASGANGTADPLPPGSKADPHTGTRDPGPAEDSGTLPAARPPGRTVLAPVRIADAATVGLLHPGDRIDVIATPVSPQNTVGGGQPEPKARIVAAGVRVEEVPDTGEDSSIEGGALLVLSVTREVAADLASAGAVSQLTVTLC